MHKIKSFTRTISTIGLDSYDDHIENILRYSELSEGKTLVEIIINGSIFRRFIRGYNQTRWSDVVCLKSKDKAKDVRSFLVCVSTVDSNLELLIDKEIQDISDKIKIKMNESNRFEEMDQYIKGEVNHYQSNKIFNDLLRSGQEEEKINKIQGQIDKVGDRAINKGGEKQTTKQICNLEWTEIIRRNIKLPDFNKFRTFNHDNYWDNLNEDEINIISSEQTLIYPEFRCSTIEDSIKIVTENDNRLKIKKQRIKKKMEFKKHHQMTVEQIRDKAGKVPISVFLPALTNYPEVSVNIDSHHFKIINSTSYNHIYNTISKLIKEFTQVKNKVVLLRSRINGVEIREIEENCFNNFDDYDESMWDNYYDD